MTEHVWWEHDLLLPQATQTRLERKSWGRSCDTNEDGPSRTSQYTHTLPPMFLYVHSHTNMPPICSRTSCTVLNYLNLTPIQLLKCTVAPNTDRGWAEVSSADIYTFNSTCTYVSWHHCHSKLVSSCSSSGILRRCQERTHHNIQLLHHFFALRLADKCLPIIKQTSSTCGIHIQEYFHCSIISFPVLMESRWSKTTFQNSKTIKTTWNWSIWCNLSLQKPEIPN